MQRDIVPAAWTILCRLTRVLLVGCITHVTTNDLKIGTVSVFKTDKTSR
jgi:hypothetical protein